jgi:cyclopropane fatty-acyl-phospholipid synthase-like methyltransferase
MKNLAAENPNDDLHGRLMFSTAYVLDDDVTEKIVLNIGCGFGWLELNFLSRKVGKMYGLELDNESLVTAKKYVNHSRVILDTGSAMLLPYDNEKFDTVTSWEVIEHIPKNTENIMFSEIYRVLKKGGIFYLSTPFDSLICKSLDPAWWLIGHRHYSLESISIFAKNNGFIIKDIQVRGGYWELLSMFNLYIAKWIFRRKPFLKSFIDKRLDIEFSKKNGFTNIFVKLQKPFLILEDQ